MKIQQEVKIGFVITLAIALLIWGMNFLKGRNILSGNERYYIVYERIEGLVETSPVLFRGYKIGQVDNIHFKEPKKDKLIVEISIEKHMRLPLNTQAIIFSSDLMGTKAIKLSIPEITQYHEPGDTLVPVVEADLTEQVSVQMLPLKNKAESLMKEIQDALTIIRLLFNEQTRDNVIKSVESIKNISVNLEKTSSKFDTLKFESIIANIESITRNIKNSNKDVNVAIKNLSNISDSIAKSDLSATIEGFKLAISQLSAIANQINKGQGSLGMLINDESLYMRLDGVVGDLDTLVQDISNNPKKYVHFSIFGGGKENPKEK